MRDKGFIWNPRNCECDKSCVVGEYLDYKIVSAEKGQLINQLKNAMKMLMEMK